MRSLAMAFVLLAGSTTALASPFRVVIDAGHGGSNTGAPGLVAGAYEKRVTLAVARALADELRARGLDVRDDASSRRVPDAARARAPGQRRRARLLRQLAHQRVGRSFAPRRRDLGAGARRRRCRGASRGQSRARRRAGALDRAQAARRARAPRRRSRTRCSRRWWRRPAASIAACASMATTCSRA